MFSARADCVKSSFSLWECPGEVGALAVPTVSVLLRVQALLELCRGNAAHDCLHLEAF